MAHKNTEKYYACRFTRERMVADGRLDEDSWRKAGVLDFFVPVSGRKARSRTEGRLLWSDKCLHVGFRAYDRDIWGYFKKRDSNTYFEDVLEIFIRPGLKARFDSYYNFEINPLGTIYDAFNVKKNAGGEDAHRWSRWNCRGLKVGVLVKGTLNDCSDEDEYWQLEATIPFASLPTLCGRTPVKGDIWKFHLARYDYSVYLPGGVELSSCARMRRADFHNVSDWRCLRFE